MSVPPAPTSIDCENAALALLDDTAQPAGTGEYRIVSDCLPANDVLPGDSYKWRFRRASRTLRPSSREVDVQLTSLAYPLSSMAASA
jgi:hypothetical protein